MMQGRRKTTLRNGGRDGGKWLVKNGGKNGGGTEGNGL